MEKKEKIIFWTIIVVGIVVRLFNWPNIISEINCDEIMTAINANSIAETGKDIYGTSYPVYLEAWRVAGQSVFLMYCITLCIKIFGFSIFAVRLPMLLISIICLFVFYDLCKRIFKSTKPALIGLFILAICPWHILQSIWSIDCNMFPHTLLISVYMLYRGLENKKLLYLSMVLFGLTMYTYGEAIYLVPFLLLIVGIYLLRNKEISVKQLVICILIYLIVFLPLLLMFILNAFGIDKNIHIGAMTIQYFSSSTRTDDMLFFSKNFIDTLIRNIGSLSIVILFQIDGLPWNSSGYFGTVYRCSLIFIFLAIYDIIRIKKKDGKLPKELFIIIMWGLMSLIIGIVINNVNINRLNCIWYPLIFAIAYGINYIVGKNKLVGKIVISMYTVIFVAFSIYLHTSYAKQVDMSGCFSRGYYSAIKYADSLKKDELVYSNINNDGTLDVYTTFQTTIDKQNHRKESDVGELIEQIKDINEKQVFIIKLGEYEQLCNLLNNNYQIKEFGNFIVIYN